MFANIIKAADLGWLATDKINKTELSTTFTNVRTREFWHFEHIIWTR